MDRRVELSQPSLHEQRPAVKPFLERTEHGRYLAALSERLRGALGENLLALLATGSAATDDMAPTSDIDAIVVSGRPLPEADRRRLAERLSHRALPCPARKLELVLYPRDALNEPEHRPRFGLNLNTGAGMPDHVGLDPDAEPRHWFLLDLAIARDRGRSLIGPPPEVLLPAIPREWLVDAASEALDWHLETEPATANSVLNACRAWRYAEEGVWSSKPEAAAWTRARTNDPATVEAALGIRTGRGREGLDPARVAVVVEEARSALGVSGRPSGGSGPAP